MANNFVVEAVFRAVDRMTNPINGIQARVARFTNSLDGGLNGLNSRVDGMIGGLGRAGLAVGALAAAGVGLAVIADQITEADVMAQKLARTTGINIELLDALTAAIAPAGFEFETITDLMEELNNKMGESAGIEEIGGVTDSLQILGLQYKELAKLSPEDQFKRVMDAAIGMADAQAAASAVDILMGGDANKVLGILREKGATIDEISAKYQEMNFRTAESRAGAEKLQASFAMVKGVLGNLASEVAGLIGLGIEPLTDRLREWIKSNKELVTAGLTTFVTELTESVVWLVENFAEIVTWTKRVGIGLAVFFAFVIVLKTMILVMTVLNLVMALNPFGLMVLSIIALIALVAALVIYWDDVTRAFREAGLWVDVLIFAIAALGGPVGWLIAAALYIYRNWDTLKGFFVGLWAVISAAFAAGTARMSALWARAAAAMSATWASVRAAFSAGVSAIVALAGRIAAGWGRVGSFFSGLWSGIKSTFSSAVDFIANKLNWISNKAQSVMNLGRTVGRFFSSGGGGAAVVSPAARNAAAAANTTNTSNATVTIKDRTNSARVTSGKMPKGVKVLRTGGM